mgnify:CR=1 FL=1
MISILKLHELVHEKVFLIFVVVINVLGHAAPGSCHAADHSIVFAHLTCSKGLAFVPSAAGTVLPT